MQTSPPQSNLRKARRSRRTTQRSIGCNGTFPNSPPKLSLPLQWSPTPSNTAIPQPTPLTTLNNIRIQSVILPHYTFWTVRQTDSPTHTHTHTHKPTDGISNRSIPTALTLYSIARERHANKVTETTWCAGNRHAATGVSVSHQPYAAYIRIVYVIYCASAAKWPPTAAVAVAMLHALCYVFVHKFLFNPHFDLEPD